VRCLVAARLRGALADVSQRVVGGREPDDLPVVARLGASSGAVAEELGLGRVDLDLEQHV
jgi:hypothetical protein